MANKQMNIGNSTSQVDVTVTGSLKVGTKNVLTEHQSLSNLAVSQALSSTANLNSITTPGFYNAAGSNKVTNKPTGVDYFGLEVIHDATGNYFTQRLYSVSKCYTRHCVGGTWGNWREDFMLATVDSDGLMSSSDKKKLDKVVYYNYTDDSCSFGYTGCDLVDIDGEYINLLGSNTVAVGSSNTELVELRNKKVNNMVFEAKQLDLNSVPGGIAIHGDYGIKIDSSNSDNLDIGDINEYDNAGWTRIINDCKCLQSLYVEEGLEVNGGISCDSLTVGGGSVSGANFSTIAGSIVSQYKPNFRSEYKNYLKFSTNYGTYMIAWGIAYLDRNGSLMTITFPTSFGSYIPSVTLAGESSYTVAGLYDVSASNFRAVAGDNGYNFIVGENISRVYWIAMGKCS